MAINRFIDESGTNLNHYILTDKNGVSYNITLLRNANITQNGTPLNASTLNALVDGINNVNYSVSGNTLSLTKPDGSKVTYTPSFSDINTTYTLTKNGDSIVLQGSDGSSTQVKDDNTTYTLGSFGVNSTSTELNYLQGATSNIQGQINTKAPKKYIHNIYIKVSGFDQEEGNLEFYFKFPSKSSTSFTGLSFANLEQLLTGDLKKLVGTSYFEASGYISGLAEGNIFAIKQQINDIRVRFYDYERHQVVEQWLEELMYEGSYVTFTLKDTVGTVDED